MNELDNLCVNTLRFLAVDAVEQALSGHPGLPLGAAPMAYALWDRFLRHNPVNAKWFNRDRFILSAGHGSALLYALLHLSGYIAVDDLKHFRQLASRTPGHPEYRCTPGVEATTGPLGQGFAMGVGMAIAEAHLASRLNQPDFPIVDHYTYAVVSDGDLMEGISSEAASLAGTLKLGKLIYLFDDNHISIEGDTNLAFTENVPARFAAFDWHVQTIDDGNDLDAIEIAIRNAQENKTQPSLIAIRTHIGFGSPKQDSAACHGAPLGREALEHTKRALGHPIDPMFCVPEEVKVHFARAIQRGAELESEWNRMLLAYRRCNPRRAAAAMRIMSGIPEADWRAFLPIFEPDKTVGIATRSASGKVMNLLAPHIPELLGGSADLSPSTRTTLSAFPDFSAENREGRNIHFGVREHAMGAIVNGMSLHGGTIPFGSTFFAFSDYMRPALRLAALMQAHALFVFTHDSIAVGEDGPTHQPVEQLMSLRSIPGLVVLRPADANETAASWEVAMSQPGPVVLVLSRQNLPVLDSRRYPIFSGVRRGAYTLLDCAEGPDLILIGTGSELHLAIAAEERMRIEGVRTRVVSMPSWDLFEQQSSAYKRQVLPTNVPKLSIEAGVTLGWQKYVGDTGATIGIDRFGASAPANSVMRHLGLSVDGVCARATRLLQERELTRAATKRTDLRPDSLA